MKYSKLYYEIHKEEYHERYLKNRDKILSRNAERKEEKSLYDHLRNLKNYEKKKAYNKEYWRRTHDKDKVRTS